MTELEAALRDMLGPSVAVALTDPRDQTDDLMPQEQAYIARAIPKRRREFTAGRRAARAAMAKLDRPAQAIPMGPDRAPIWPQGIMGSISHCDTVCIAALIDVTGRTQSVGIDVEPAIPLSPDLEKIICTETERDWLDTIPQKIRGLRAKQIFCAKEATYKALYPVTGKLIGFHDVELQIDGHSFMATPLGAPPLHGRLEQVYNYVLGSVLHQM